MKIRFTGTGDLGGGQRVYDAIVKGVGHIRLKANDQIDVPDEVGKQWLLDFPYDFEEVGGAPSVSRGPEPTHKPRPAQRFGRRRMNNYRDK